MGQRIILLIAAVSLIVSCTKTSIPEIACDSHEIVVSIADTQIDTKSTVNIEGGQGKTSFSLGDELQLYDNLDKSAVYIYKSKRSGDDGEEYVFENRESRITIPTSRIDTNNIVAAFYPAGSFTYSYADEMIESYVTFGQQTYTKNNANTQTIYAPMASVFSINGSFVFSNISCLLQISINCVQELENQIVVEEINVEIDKSYAINLAGNFKFCWWMEGDEVQVYIEQPSPKPKPKNSVTLSGCEIAGALTNSNKYFYIILPPIYDCDNINPVGGGKFFVKVLLNNGKSVSRTFTATKGGANSITKNTILDFPPITINPSDLL